MDSNEIRRSLEKWGHLDDLAEVKLFEGCRKNEKGESVEVTVKILDLGPSNPQYRYNCIASTGSGQEALGNGSSSIDDAISIVHWNELG